LSIRKAPENYTQSTLSDAIKRYLEQSDEFDIILHLWWIERCVFLFDITKDEEMMDYFDDSHNGFRQQTKRAIREIWSANIPRASSEELAKRSNWLTIRITDARSLKMAEWGPQHLSTPYAVDCVILTMDERRTYTKSGWSSCWECNKVFELSIDPLTHRIKKIPKCDNEECEHYDETTHIMLETLETGYIRTVKIQEPMEEAKHGSPIIFECEILDNDVYTTHIGQRKRIIGTFLSIPERRESTNRIIIRAISTNDSEDESLNMPTESQLSTFKKMSSQDDYFDILCRSFAPQLYKDKQTRLAVLVIILALARGTKVEGLNLRGDINVLLVGDPSLGKTKMLEFIPLITQKSAYVNGRMASGPGITVGMDQLSGGKRVPRAGPIPLCTKGFVAIDEMGRMRKEDLSALHESMESGTITFTKAGYNFQLEAETTIIGAANPKSDVWENALNMVDNINLSKTILSRFDLIVNLRDIKDDIEDQKKMQHILQMRRGDSLADILKPKEMESLLNYIRLQSPKMERKAELKITAFYEKMRKLEQDEGSRAIDWRLFESIYRISTAIAKLKFSETVCVEHVELAIEIMKESFLTLGMKVEEGETISTQDSITTDKEMAFLKACRKLEAVTKDAHFELEDLFQVLRDESLQFYKNDEEMLKKFIQNKVNEKSLLMENLRYKLGT